MYMVQVKVFFFFLWSKVIRIVLETPVLFSPSYFKNAGNLFLNSWITIYAAQLISFIFYNYIDVCSGLNLKMCRNNGFV